VMVGRGDPVATGLANSVARPGGTITGITVGSPELVGKRQDPERCGTSSRSAYAQQPIAADAGRAGERETSPAGSGPAAERLRYAN
jgi:hypothetical protein